jgi:hypothetical protein
MKYLISMLSAFIIVCCTSTDSNQPLSSLQGTFVFKATPPGDTVQLRFANDSVLYQSVNSAPEIKLKYSFRDQYLIAIGVDSSDGSITYAFAGKVTFNENFFDFAFANGFKANGVNQLNTTWYPLEPWDGPEDSIQVIRDSMLVKFHGNIGDTTHITVDSDRIREIGSKAPVYDYKIFSDTLFLTYWKTWRFNKI